MKQNTGTPLATRPKNPLGPVFPCVCGRLNDQGRDPECPDCGREVRDLKVYAVSGKLTPGGMYALEREAMRDFLRVEEGGAHALPQRAAYGLGLFAAQAIEDDVRGRA